MSGSREERSAGVILYKTEGQRRVYLILQYAAGHWDFAKGKKIRGETDMQAALREVREETGITDVPICDDFKEEIKYEFMRDGTAIRKTVVFFLGRTESSNIALSGEHTDYTWQEYNDAILAVTHEAARRVLAGANRVLAGAA